MKMQGYILKGDGYIKNPAHAVDTSISKLWL